MTPKIVIFFLLLCTFSFAQEEKISRLQHFDKSKIRYGFYLGLHQKGYAVESYKPVSVGVGSGFQLGVIADYNLTQNISIFLEPGIMSSSSTLSFGGRTFDLNTTYFRFPVSLKLTTDRINNFRVFATGGLSMNYNFNTDENNNNNGADPYDFSLKTTTVAAEISMGFNIYLPYFKLTPSLKGIYGVNSEFSGENMGSTTRTYTPYKLNSRAIMFSLIFQ